MVVTDAGPGEVSIPVAAERRARQQEVARQFAKFCLVGFLSTVLNAALFRLFWHLGFGKNGSHVCAFSLAVTNGFFINRAWTFRRSGSGEMKQQYLMFIAVNLVGLVLAWIIMSFVGAWLLQREALHVLPGLLHSLLGRGSDVAPRAYTLGELSATPVCAVWNFTANRLWTFRVAPRP